MSSSSSTSSPSCHHHLTQQTPSPSPSPSPSSASSSSFSTINQTFYHTSYIYIYIYISLWVQTLSKKVLNLLNHTSSTSLEGTWIHRVIYIYIYMHIHIEVSINEGTPIWMIMMENPRINWMIYFGSTPHFNLHIISKLTGA
jgi:hypothetical protein